MKRSSPSENDHHSSSADSSSTTESKKPKLTEADNKLLNLGVGATKRQVSEEQKKKLMQGFALLGKPSAVVNKKKIANQERELDVKLIKNIPIDYTLKTFITFKSSANFIWTNNISGNSKVVGLSSFVTGNSTSNVVTNTRFSQSFSQSPMIPSPIHQEPQTSSEFFKGLLYHIYPSSLLPHSMYSKIRELPNYNRENLENLSDVYETFDKNLQRLDIEFLNERYNCWCEALISVFTSFIEGLCPYFYLLPDYGQKSSFIFLNESAFSSKAKRCIVSQPSSDLISRLKAEDIEFSEHSVNKPEMRTEADNVMLASRPEEISNQYRYLVIIGRSNLHSLIDFLGNYHLRFLDYDVPQIISPHIFINSTLKKCKLFPRTNNENGNNKPYSLEVSGGYILPHSFLDVCESVSKMNPDFICSVKDFKDETGRLNEYQGREIPTPLSSQGSGGQIFQFSSSSVAQYGESEELQGHSIRTITSSANNSFTVKLKKI